MSYNTLTSRIDNFYLTFTDGKNYQYLYFFRISIGLIALFDLLSMRSGLGVFFSQKDAILPQDLSFLFSEYFSYLDPFYSFLRDNNYITMFYNSVVWIYVLALIFLIFGIFTRVSCFVALLLQLLIFKSFALFNFGYDHFLTMSLFYCLVFPVGKFNSMDNFLFKRKNGLENNFDYQKIIRYHLAIVYLFSGLAKIVSITWWNGEAMWRAVSTIHDNYFKIPPILLAFAGVATILIETNYPLLVAYKRTRKFTCYAMITMHVFIAIMLDLPLFATIMIVWNVTSYYDFFQKNSVK